MQALKDTLEAMKSPEDSEKDSQHGLMTTGGAMTMPHREIALTEKELTQIASLMLVGVPLLTSTRKPIYGRKSIKDEFGETFNSDNMIVGYEECFEVTVVWNDSKSAAMYDAALRRSPPSATIAHLTHLSLHKRLGTSDKDRPVLLADYGRALAPYSDFIVYIACKIFWERDPSQFFPKIAALVEVCEGLHYEFTSTRSRLVAVMAGTHRSAQRKTTSDPLTRKDKSKGEWTAEEWAEYIAHAEGMISVAEKEPKIMNVEGWRKEAELRKAQRDTHLNGHS